MKKLINPNLSFIWSDLMSNRGRNLTLATLAIVMIGSAVQTATPYGLGLMIDALKEESKSAGLFGLTTYAGLALLTILLGWCFGTSQCV
jgi:hypothetical protein